MGLRINTNVEAFNAHRNLVDDASKLSKSMEKLSSRLPHQPRCRRRSRSRHLRAHAGPDPRSRAGTAQRPGRHQPGPDGGRRPAGDALHPAACPRARGAVPERRVRHAVAGGDHGRGRAALGRGQPHDHGGELQRHPAAERRPPTPGILATLQVGPNLATSSRSARGHGAPSIGGAIGVFTNFATGSGTTIAQPTSTRRSTRSRHLARASVRSRTGSSTRPTRSASTRRT